MKRIFKLTFIGGILLLFSGTLQAQTELYKKMSQTKSIESFYYTRNMLNESSFSDFDDASFNFMNLDRNKIQNIEYLSSTKRSREQYKNALATESPKTENQYFSITGFFLPNRTRQQKTLYHHAYPGSFPR